MKLINVSLFQKLSNQCNAHQVSLENSPTKSLVDHRQSEDLDLHSRSQVRLKLDYLKKKILAISRTIFKAITFKLDIDRRLTACIIIIMLMLVSFDDLELDLDFEKETRVSRL